MTRDETQQLVEVLCEAYQEKRVGTPDATVTAYWIALDDVPFDLGQLAVRHLIRTAKWFPKPAEVRTAALDLALPLPDAEEAWRLVQAEMRRVSGIYGKPEFAVETITEAVRAISWWRLCTSEEPERIAHEFKQMYLSLRRRAIEVARPDALWSGGPIIRVLPPAEEVG